MNHIECIVCGKKAIKCFSPDLDIQGICTCKKHFEDVSLAYIALIGGDAKMFKSLIEIAKKENK